jgi:hypothetical protein
VEGKATRVGDTGTGLSVAMEKNVRASALSYAVFFVNAFYYGLWLVLSTAVLANAPVLVYTFPIGDLSDALRRNYAGSCVVSALAIAFLTNPAPLKKAV